MPSPDAVLSCADLRFRYLERFVALDGVSLDVERGTSVALLGANGCGKSTLLKVLDGLAFCEAGSYRAFGQEVTEQTIEDEEFARGFRTRVGFVFQSADAQVFSPTVRDEIAFGPLQLGIDAEEAHWRVDDVLAMLGIARLAERAPHQLSGGEKKRVAIASVLVTNPEVLLFDEPTAGLDPRTQGWLLELLVELRAAGKTIVLATHDLDVLEAVCTRALVLGEDHRLLAEGTPGHILGDRGLLLDANLVHDHRHAHGDVVHDHEHGLGHHRRGHNGVPCSASSTSMALSC
jgi:cobalt/nickel transport system ATP-binding protein